MESDWLFWIFLSKFNCFKKKLIVSKTEDYLVSIKEKGNKMRVFV